jgi:hypothetical protein
VQHLVFGAAEYARGLGFQPHPDLYSCLGHLGTWSGPSAAITFGEHGKLLYVSDPRDDAPRVLRTLDRAVGTGNYHSSLACRCKIGSSGEKACRALGACRDVSVSAGEPPRLAGALLQDGLAAVAE